MKAGKLRHRIKFYKKQSVRPIGGSATVTWEHMLTLSASFEPLSVKDVINAKAADSQIVARCVIRYREDIDSTMQIVHKGRTYEIDGDPLPDPNSGIEYLTLMLRERSHGK